MMNVDHNDPTNPYWVIYTLALVIGDIFVQTFKSKRKAQKYAFGKYKDNFVVRQICICRKEDSDLVIDSIDTLNGLLSIIDYTESEGGDIETTTTFNSLC